MCSMFFFFFNDTATTEIYTLSLHDALPISFRLRVIARDARPLVALTTSSILALVDTLYAQEADFQAMNWLATDQMTNEAAERSEEHTSELQSPCNLVCRLLLEKKKK